jgi:hypothetical protein
LETLTAASQPQEPRQGRRRCRFFRRRILPPPRRPQPPDAFLVVDPPLPLVHLPPEVDVRRRSKMGAAAGSRTSVAVDEVEPAPPNPRRCCSGSGRRAPLPGRTSTVPISPADVPAALSPGVRALTRADDDVCKARRRRSRRPVRDVDPRPAERGADQRRRPRWWRRGLQRRLDDVSGVSGEETQRRHPPSGCEGPLGVAVGERATSCSSRPVHPRCRSGRWRRRRGWRSAAAVACYG